VGQKVHPIGFRLGVIKDWQGRWYANRKEYTALLHEDVRVRTMIMERLADAGISRVEIERSANQLTVIISAAKPGIVIGKAGAKVEELRRGLEELTGKKVRVTIQEIRQPEVDATLVARSVAEQLVRRVAFRRAMKQAVLRARRFGAKGIRVQVGGRLGGAEMSRTEWERDGRVPLHTLRADIDFGQAEAHTTYGVIGVKVWIYRGDILPEARGAQTETPPPPPTARAPRARAATRARAAEAGGAPRPPAASGRATPTTAPAEPSPAESPAEPTPAEAGPIAEADSQAASIAPTPGAGPAAEAPPAPDAPSPEATLSPEAAPPTRRTRTAAENRAAEASGEPEPPSAPEQTDSGSEPEPPGSEPAEK
jgi:small subunit ribosomal protein S3